jgi:transposase-like protein
VFGYSKHFRVQYGRNEFVRGNSHVNSIESFWSYAKGRQHRFHGVAPEKFYLHLKECEYWFNLRKNNVYAELLKLLRKYPL